MAYFKLYFLWLTNTLGDCGLAWVDYSVLYSCCLGFSDVMSFVGVVLGYFASVAVLVYCFVVGLLIL